MTLFDIALVPTFVEFPFPSPQSVGATVCHVRIMSIFGQVPPHVYVCMHPIPVALPDKRRRQPFTHSHRSTKLCDRTIVLSMTIRRNNVIVTQLIILRGRT
uniref:Secreted protein n=1 Tax=Panagrellus redivivus TaxID=6233 RepID=A0A7E4VBB9_PANRE